MAERRLAVGGMDKRFENVRLYVIDRDRDPPDTGQLGFQLAVNILELVLDRDHVAQGFDHR